jgi:DNA-binding transcriptional LysR family regulator
MDRLRSMEILVRAAEAGSFARAAELLQVDPSAVSHAIAQFERELGLALFYRTTRQLRLTPDGEEVRIRAREILARVDDIASLGAHAKGRLTGVLRVGMGGAIGRHVVIPRLPYFMRRHPDLKLECYVRSEVRDMHAGGLDLMLRAGVPPEADLVARKILDIRFGVFAAPGYLRSAGEPAVPEDLLGHRCLIHKPPSGRKVLDEWTFEKGPQRRVLRVPRSLVTDDREGLIDAVLAGGGLMRIGMFDPALVSSGQLQRLLPDWDCVGSAPVYALYRRGSRVSPKVAAFLRFVDEAFRGLDPRGLTLLQAARSAPLPPGTPPLPIRRQRPDPKPETA